MRKFIIGCMLLLLSIPGFAQNTNPVNIFEGYTINNIRIVFLNPPADSTLTDSYRRIIEQQFVIQRGTPYSATMAGFYNSRINLLPFVDQSTISLSNETASEVSITLNVKLSEKSEPKKIESGFKDKAVLPTLINTKRFYLTLQASASEMAFSNNNAWFGNPTVMTTGNPLATNPAGAGMTAWLEGFGSAGIYSVFNLIPKIQLHLYGGASYIASFSAGNELFTTRARIHGDVEDAFIGFVGGNKLKNGNKYLYNVTYGRKSFVIGDGFLLINTSMNGYDRAALQLNPRWASKELFTGLFQWNKLMFQVFNVKPNELDILNSHTVLRGLNAQFNDQEAGTAGFTFMTSPKSNFTYYLPDGTMHKRKGLQVYNLRYYRLPTDKLGLLVKSEVAFERNKHFDMKARAYYIEAGWQFRKTFGSPNFSYRYASFSGDNPKTKAYERWDALYTGGNGEQWVQGSNMYKVFQNSNERTHRIQAIFAPARKIQLVGQFWVFMADEYNNIGGNPALSTLSSKFLGTEYNLTFKYFISRHWYFHFNTAYTVPGKGIRNSVPDSKDWFSIMGFIRYSF
ncbi:MAG: alginate export family protein [Bacteroidales bacterium]